MYLSSIIQSKDKKKTYLKLCVFTQEPFGPLYVSAVLLLEQHLCRIIVSYYPGLRQHKQQTSFCTYVSDFFSLSPSACCHLLLNEIHHERASQSNPLQAAVIKK